LPLSSRLPALQEVLAPKGLDSGENCVVVTRVLFVCLGNSCRSPMAEALARHLASDVIEASSAGLNALGYVATPTHAVLRENRVASDGLASKSLSTIDLDAIDLVINLSGRPIRKHLAARVLPVEDWEVGDPFGFDLELYRKIRDEIEARILDLATRLRTKVHERAQLPGQEN
jgi:arsenate reductase